MNSSPFLNLGCGFHFNQKWINVDFVKTGHNVIAHNLLVGIPFDNGSFEVVYHSHVLEHMPKNDAKKFIKECYRVLKVGGVIRIAVPDLEQIVNNYSRLLGAGKEDPDNENIREDYDWIITEMYDQTVRTESGGEMAKYLAKDKLINEDFIMKRIGHEGYLLRESIKARSKTPVSRTSLLNKFLNKLKAAAHADNYKKLFLKTFFPKEYELLKQGRFRMSGEIHQWMYDIYSLSGILKETGFKNITQQDFETSKINGWKAFELDEVNGKVRKPDSIFIEAIK